MALILLLDYSIVRAKTLHPSLIWQFDDDQFAFACQPSGSSLLFFLPGGCRCQVSACQPWVRPVCFSFKSKMCIANLTDDLSLVGPSSYLAPLGSKSIARLSCYAGTTRAEGPNRGGTQDVRDESVGHVLDPHFGGLLDRHVWPSNSIFFVELQSPALVVFSVEFVL